MKIRYLGTGAAEGVPAAFCNCETCVAVRKRKGKEIHTRSQIVIDGILGLEFPPDAYYHSLEYDVDLSALRYLIVTHSHMDHFYAHDFILRGYKYALDMTSQTFDIYGNEEVKKVFAECTRREMKDCVAPFVRVHALSSYQTYEIGEYQVTPLRAQHSAEEEAFVYLVQNEGKTYLHLTDTGRLYDEVYDYFKKHPVKVNAVCFDCTFLDYTKGPVGRHMGIEDNMAVKEKFLSLGVFDENTKYYITHYSHNSAPFSEKLDMIGEKYSVIPLYDGMEIEI